MPGMNSGSSERRQREQRQEQERLDKVQAATTPTFAPMVPATNPVAPAVPAAPSTMDQINTQNSYWQNELKKLLPMYQERLGGFDSATAQAMRNRGTQQIQSQYGAGLRAAMNQAGNQGIRGPAAVAMQQDIRNQMGQATAGFERDLNIANWDAGRQALADYYGTNAGIAGIDIGSLAAMQQLQNAQTGSTNYQRGINSMSSGSGFSSGGLWNQVNPLTSPYSPVAYIPGVGSRA